MRAFNRLAFAIIDAVERVIPALGFGMFVGSIVYFLVTRH